MTKNDHLGRALAGMHACMYVFIYLLAVLVLVSTQTFSLLAASGGYSLAVVHGLLTVAASLLAGHGL